MNIALVAFRGTVAADIVRRAAEKYSYYEVGSSRRLIDEFCDSDILQDADYIVAAGVYRGSNPQYVHVESICTDSFKQYVLDTSLADGNLFRKTSTIKNSWCNVLAAQLAQTYPQKRIAFLHMSSQLHRQQVEDELLQALAHHAQDCNTLNTLA